MALSREKLAEMGLSEEQIEGVMQVQEGEPDWQGEYDRVSRQFGEYRDGVERRAKREAFRHVLREVRIPEKYFDMIAAKTDIDGLALEGDGLRDAAAVREAVRRDWGDFVARDVVRTIPVDTPPDGGGPVRKSVQEIMAIRDDAKRVREIAVNHDLFGF